MALPPSKLTQVIKDLPEDFKMSGKSIANSLKKQGVKDEELKFAELGLPEPNSSKAMEQWNKQQLVDAEKNRADKQSVTSKKGRNNTDYGTINVVPPTKDYEERIYKFDNSNYEFRSAHFPEDGKNYLAHTRIQPMDINGKKARTILEVQSDVNIANRQASVTGQHPIANAVLNDTLNDLQYDDIYRYFELEQEDVDLADLGDFLLRKSAQELDDVAKYIGMKGPETTSKPYEKNMTRKLLERELFAAVDEGAEYTSIPIRGDAIENLHRSPEIQKQYETTVVNTAQKIAKQQGLTTAIETSTPRAAAGDELAKLLKEFKDNPLDSEVTARIQDFVDKENIVEVLPFVYGLQKGEVTPKEFGVLSDHVVGELKKGAEYLVISHPKGTKLDMKLYAGPSATAGAAYLAYKEGYSESEVSEYLVQTQGYAPEEAKEFAAQTKQAIDAGYSEEEIKQFFNSQEPPEPELEMAAKTPATSEAIVKPIQPGSSAANQATHWNTYAGGVARAANSTAFNAQELIADQNVLNPVMASTLQQTKAFIGYDNKTNQFVQEKQLAQRQQIINFAAAKGVQIEFDPTNSGWKVMTPNGWQDANPTIWKEIKNISGEVAGAMVGAAIGAKYTTIGGAYGRAAGILLGGAVGSVVGSELDYIYQAMDHNAKMDLEIQQQRMVNAAQASLLYDAIGYSVLKAPGAAVGAFKTMKAIPAKVEERLAGAAQIDKALADTLFLNRDEGNDLVRIMERFSEVPGKTEQDKRIAAALFTQPGSEGIAAAAARIDPLASRAISKTIDNRAQDLLKTANELSDDNLTRLVQQDLKNYEDDVKNFYTDVKLKAAKAPLANVYQFNINSLAIEPVLESLKKNIDDPRTMEKFMLQVQRVQHYGLTRDFNDLLEMRKIVNNFKYNTKITSAKDFERVNEVVKNIDTAIADGAKRVLPDSDTWLTEFKQANYQYAKMMTVKQNVLYKALSKPGIDYDKTVSALTRYITAEDSTFVDVIQKLPKSTRTKVEGSVINALAEKYTAGQVGGERAVYFPQLSSALEKTTFTTPEARKFKQAVKEMAEVFRNDVPLAQVSGGLSAPRDASLLTSDLLAATKRHIAQKIFNHGRRMLGDGTTKMIYKAAEVLENPLNIKSINELMKELDGSVNIADDIRTLTSAAAKEQAEKGQVGAPKVLLYGQGKVLGPKGPGVPTKIALHRIASIDDAMKVAEAEGIARSDTVALDARLLDMGYKAVQYGADKVRLLD